MGDGSDPRSGVTSQAARDRRPGSLYDAYIFDLDGTVYLGDALLPSAGETITSLRNLGRRTVFLSNNPTHSRAEYAAKLTRLGLPTSSTDIINSTVVMVDFLKRLYASTELGAVRRAPALCGGRGALDGGVAGGRL